MITVGFPGAGATGPRPCIGSTLSASGVPDTSDSLKIQAALLDPAAIGRQSRFERIIWAIFARNPKRNGKWK